jgi:DNA-directed RNA polymerase beta' subunit/DNA-directed RNA polymerase subunit K/omega
LGFVGDTKPVDLIMQGILVTPPQARAPSTNKKGELIPNPFTSMYIDILKSINNKSNAPGKIFKAVKNMIIKNETKTGGGQTIKSASEFIQGKKGLYRSAIMGKRSDYCGRSVAGAGHSLALNEAELPSYWAKILTSNLTVTAFNIDQMIQLLGAGRITNVTSIKGFRKPAQNIKTLTVGEKVELILRPGDRVIIGRQPTLSKYSIMAFKVILQDSFVIRSHLGITKPFNLDYDGDELNVWKPRNFEVEAEYEYLMDVNQCIISSETGKPSMGLVMNSVTAVYLLSEPGVEIEESIYNDMIGTLLNTDALPSLFDRMRKYGLEPYREDNDGKKYYSGSAAFSALLPIDFNYTSKNVIIFEGVLIRGTLTSAQVGTGARSIVNDLAKFYSLERAGQFLTDAPHLLNVWLITKGYTVGIKDCANMVIDSKAEIYNKQYNKRAQLFETQYNKYIKLILSKQGISYIDNLLPPIFNKILDVSLDKEFNTNLKEQEVVLSNIVTAWKNDKKCKVSFEPLKSQIYNLYQNFANAKNDFKVHINNLLTEINNIFNQITGTVTNRLYMILKSITHLMEQAFILSGEAKDLNYLYNKLHVDEKGINNIDNLLSLDNINDVISTYTDTVKQFITDILEVVKQLKHCIQGTTNKQIIDNTLLGIYTENLLIIGSLMYSNLIKELNREYNKNTLIRNDELAKIYLEVEGLGSKKDLNAEELAHYERLITSKVDVAKIIGSRIAKNTPNNAIIMQTEEGSGTKGTVLNVGQIMGSVGQQYVSGKRLWHQFPRLSSHYDGDDDSLRARGLVESSFYEGLTPTELFYIQGASRENIIDTAMLTPLVGHLQRLLARSMENIIIASDGSLRNTNGFMYAPMYNAGFSIEKTIRVGTNEFPTLNNFIDLAKIITDENHKRGWFTVKEIKSTNLPMPKTESLEDKLKILLNKPLKMEKEHKIPISTNNDNYKITVYEKVRIIGTRATIIDKGDMPRIAKAELGDEINPLKIAEREYQLGLLANAPALFIQRKIPGKKEPVNVYPTLENI